VVVYLLLFTALTAVFFISFFFVAKKTGNFKKALSDLKLLHDVSKDISSKLEMTELLPAIMNAFVRAGNVSKGSLMLFNKDKQILEIKAAVGLSERAREYVKLRPGEGIAGKVAESKSPVLINDTIDEAEYKDFFAGEKSGRPRETLLCLPLIFQDEVLGVITLDSKFTGGQFIRNDERLLSILASHAAVAINNAKMYEMATTDDLTGLYIRRHFLQRLNQEIEKARRYHRKLSLIFLDIDHFKEFNDSHGHQLGDNALIHLSGIMKRKVRTSDICARYGGEEFVIILPETSKKAAVTLAERLRKSVETTPFYVKGKEYRITISLGIAEFKPDMDCQQIIKTADQNMYRAKEMGRNTIV